MCTYEWTDSKWFFTDKRFSITNFVTTLISNIFNIFMINTNKLNQINFQKHICKWTILIWNIIKAFYNSFNCWYMILFEQICFILLPVNMGRKSNFSQIFNIHIRHLDVIDAYYLVILHNFSNLVNKSSIIQIILVYRTPC